MATERTRTSCSEKPEKKELKLMLAELMRLWRTMTTSTRKREKPKALRKATERISSRTWKMITKRSQSLTSTKWTA